MSVLSDKQFLWIAGALAVGGLYLYVKKGAIAEAVNPLNDENIFYRGVNAVGDALDDNQDNDSFTLGGWIWDITHPEWRTGIPNQEAGQ